MIWVRCGAFWRVLAILHSCGVGSVIRVRPRVILPCSCARTRVGEFFQICFRLRPASYVGVHSRQPRALQRFVVCSGDAALFLNCFWCAVVRSNDYGAPRGILECCGYSWRIDSVWCVGMRCRHVRAPLVCLVSSNIGASVWARRGVRAFLLLYVILARVWHVLAKLQSL